MIDCYSIMNAVKVYYLPEATDRQLLPLCEAAASELEPRIKEGVNRADIRLINAAAASVNFRCVYLEACNGEGIDSFSAGDVKIGLASGKDVLERAEKEKERAFRQALPLFKDEEFFFGKVSI